LIPKAINGVVYSWRDEVNPMPNGEKIVPQSAVAASPRQHAHQPEARLPFDQAGAGRSRSAVLSETPFRPPRDRHTALLRGLAGGPQQANLVWHLQRTYGNAYVQRLFDPGAVQPKLMVGAPNDIHEQEADRVAESIGRVLAAQEETAAPPPEGQNQPDSQWPRQGQFEQEPNTGLQPPSEMVHLSGPSQPVQAQLQMNILGTLRDWWGGLFRARKQPEPELSDEQATRLLAELEQEIEGKGGEAPPPEEALSEEDERLLAELDQEGPRPPSQELSDEESEKQLAELESELQKEPEEEMSAAELDREIERLLGLTDSLHQRYSGLLERQAKLAQKYAKLVIRDGQEEKAEQVLQQCQAVSTEREQLGEQLQEALTRLTELQVKQHDRISERLAQPLSEVSGEEQQDLENELDDLTEQEKRQAVLEEELKPGPQTALPQGADLKPEALKEDPLDWLTHRQLSAEEEAAMEEELGELERQFNEESRSEELIRVLASIHVPGIKPGEAAPGAEMDLTDQTEAVQIPGTRSGATEKKEEKPRPTALLAKSSGPLPLIVSAELENQIETGCQHGQPLSKAVRLPMEQAFKADFSGVAVHTDAEAHALNESLQARAFTTGQDIFFRSGEFNPGSASGQKLIAHELTHVVQQNKAVARPS
jgi:hypothetical protein